MQRDVDSVGGMSRAYSNASEGHAADKAALQGFAKTRDVASSPLKPVQDEQPSKVRSTHLSAINLQATVETLLRVCCAVVLQLDVHKQNVAKACGCCACIHIQAQASYSHISKKYQT